MWRTMFAMSLMSRTSSTTVTLVAPEPELAPMVPGAWRAWAVADTAPGPAAVGTMIRLAGNAKAAKTA